MNEIVNKFLLAEDKLMSEIHLRQLGLAHSACGPFTENKERNQKFKETRDSRYIYQDELGKACFQHDMADGDFTGLPRRTASDKTLHNIAKNPNYDGNQRGVTSMVSKFFNKQSSGDAVKNENMPDLQLAEHLYRPINRKF